VTEAELAEIEARLQGVTPGPWEGTWTGVFGGTGPLADGTSVIAQAPIVRHLTTAPHEEQEQNMRFVAAAREDVPRLLAEVRRLREIVEELTPCET
jgi:hypothetical protein